MAGQTRRGVLRAAGVLGVGGAAGCVAPVQTGGDGGSYDTVRVPGDHSTIQAGVDAASAGDLVLVEPGTYDEAVAVSTPDLTIRGRDRNAVVLDGGNDGGNGVEVRADGVAVENLTATGYGGTAFYWSGATGFRGSFLTAYNNGYYGIYAYGSRDGRFEHSYASGHPDAGFYLGRNHPYEAVVTDVVAEHNAIGYSGTSTGGGLTIEDSVWRYNKVGVLPNTLDTNDPPQRATRIVGNDVYGNNDADAPALSEPYPLLGMGVLLWGGSDNVVAGNRVADHDRFGIVAQRNVVDPAGNLVRDNRIDGSGVADLALGRPTGGANEFRANEFGTSLPAGIESDASAGSDGVAEEFEALEELVEAGEFPAGDWREQPEPGDQPTMREPEAAPRDVNKDTSWQTPRAQTTGYVLE